MAKVEAQEDEKDLIRVRRNREEWAHMRETEGWNLQDLQEVKENSRERLLHF